MLGYSLFAVVIAGGLVHAQEPEKARKSETKITVEDGKDIKATGCVERNADGGYMLTNVANKDGALGSYVLANDDDDDLKDHVGHRVEISGKRRTRVTARSPSRPRPNRTRLTGTNRRRRAKRRSRVTSRACAISG